MLLRHLAIVSVFLIAARPAHGIGEYNPYHLPPHDSPDHPDAADEWVEMDMLLEDGRNPFESDQRAAPESPEMSDEARCNRICAAQPAGAPPSEHPLPPLYADPSAPKKCDDGPRCVCPGVERQSLAEMAAEAAQRAARGPDDLYVVPDPESGGSHRAPYDY